MTESFKTMTIGNKPKLPSMPMFKIPDNLAPPTFDLAPPTLQTQTLDANVDFDKSSDYYFKPQFTSLPDYTNDTELKAKFKAISQINQKLDVQSFKHEDNNFFIIRSNNIDDIHKVG